MERMINITGYTGLTGVLFSTLHRALKWGICKTCETSEFTHKTPYNLQKIVRTFDKKH